MRSAPRGTTTEPVLKSLLIKTIDSSTLEAILDVFVEYRVIHREGVAVRYLGF